MDIEMEVLSILFRSSYNREEKLIHLHYLMWDWLSKNPRREKSEWPGWYTIEKYVRDPPNHCFLCLLYNKDCSICPLGEKVKESYPHYVCFLFCEWQAASFIYTHKLAKLQKILNKEDRDLEKKEVKNIRKKVINYARLIRDINEQIMNTAQESEE